MMPTYKMGDCLARQPIKLWGSIGTSMVAPENSTLGLRLHYDSFFLLIVCQVRERQDHVVSVPLGDGMLGDLAMP